MADQMMGRYGSGGRAVVWQSEGCRFDPTLGVSKCPWARHLTPNCSWWAGWYLAWQPIAVGVWMCVNGWMRGKNYKALWIKALYKCSPFTIYHDIKNRIIKARHAINTLRPILNSKAFSLRNKTIIFNINVKAVLLYRSETRRVTNKL